MRSALGGFLLMLGLPLHAAECTVRSGPTTAVLVELYTSEGCDSCPPADRWLSAIAANPSVVPIGFHVDYWDYLGWKDAYGSARHSERQRQMARIAGARTVYTPQVVVAGRSFTGWRLAPIADAALARVAATPARAAIEIATRNGIAHISTRANAGEPTGDLVLNAAIVQSGIVTQVRAGENRGATLRHDFVVRDFRSWAGWKDGALSVELPLAPYPGASVSAFVQNRATGEVLQALRSRC